MTRRVGIDVGGVLLHREENKKTHLTGGKHKKKLLEKEEKKKILTASFFPDAKETIRLLAESKQYELFILSYCQKDMETRTIKILEAHKINLWIPKENWMFVPSRKLKALVCKEKKLDIMIDDRQDVLKEIDKVNPLMTLYWFNDGNMRNEHITKSIQAKSIQIVKDWFAVQKLLLK